jgi:hypothetical protein
MMTTLFEGLRKDTYDSLVNYGGQERIKYPNRLATQLRNSQEIKNLLDGDGLSWLEENKKQMNNFTQQPVKEIEIKRGLEPNQTFQPEKILEQQEQPSKIKAHHMIDDGSSEGSSQHGEANGSGQVAKQQDGFVDTLKKEVKTKVAQEVATYAVKKVIEKLPGIIAGLS